MKCPNCGAEMADNTLYCEQCGEDIHIVPDFEPELEQNIQQTIIGIMEDLGQGTDEGREAQGWEHQQEWEEEDEDEEDEEEVRYPLRLRKKHPVWKALGVLFLIVLCVAGVIGVQIYQYNSLEYQVKAAMQNVRQEQYDKAIVCYNRAIELDETDIELRFSLAEVYLQKNNKVEYEYLLRDIARDPDATVEQLDRAYGKLIAIYRDRKDYQTIHELLLNSGNEQMISTYQNYIARPPEFSVNEGYYTSIQPLKLTAFGAGKIYYTLDGSTPDENSSQYTAPILLENGDYLVKAVFINEYGTVSEVEEKEYHIENDEILAPELSAGSGTYYSPTYIRVLSDTENVYYTTDGSDPTYASNVYTGQIPMPLGRSTYKFAQIVDGVTGTVAERNYELVISTDITPEQAVANAVAYSLSSGKIRDEAGHFDDTNAVYLYEYLYVVNISKEGDYYVIVEVLCTEDGTLTRTGSAYGVNVYTGELKKLFRDQRGSLVLEEIEEGAVSREGE